MSVGVPVCGRVAARAGVTAAQVTAAQTPAEVHPATAFAQAVLAALGRARSQVTDLVEMGAGRAVRVPSGES